MKEMKKLIIILIVILTITLSGCDRKTVMPNVDDTRYYTQEEIEELLEEHQIDINTALATITVLRLKLQELEQQIKKIEEK